jgi:hypothetical protein
VPTTPSPDATAATPAPVPSSAALQPATAPAASSETPTEATQVPAAPNLNESARGRNAAAAASRPTPRKNSPNPLCTDIIARVSLGEALSPQDHATLERECRK